MVSLPYYSHIFKDSYGSGVGIVWETYHKGVPLLGVPQNPIDQTVFLCWIFQGLPGGHGQLHGGGSALQGPTKRESRKIILVPWNRLG